MKDNYYQKYLDNTEIIELKPHEAYFYKNSEGVMSDMCPTYGHVVQKVRLVSHKFDISYFQAYALLVSHGIQISGTPIKWGSKYLEYEAAWAEIKDLCIDYQNLTFKIGYQDGVYIKPDISLGNSGLDKKAMDLYQLILPRAGEGTYKLLYMNCNDFWIYIDKFKDVEEFLIPQDDYKERKEQVISCIDKLYPEVMKYKDAFNRKVIITLDKHKRRIFNGLKHSTPTPESNQLSLDTISQD